MGLNMIFAGLGIVFSFSLFTELVDFFSFSFPSFGFTDALLPTCEEEATGAEAAEAEAAALDFPFNKFIDSCSLGILLKFRPIGRTGSEFAFAFDFFFDFALDFEPADAEPFGDGMAPSADGGSLAAALALAFDFDLLFAFPFDFDFPFAFAPPRSLRDFF